MSGTFREWLGLAAVLVFLGGPAMHAGGQEWRWPSRGYLTQDTAPVSPFNIGQLPVGAKAPSLEVTNELGEPFDFLAYISRKPTVLAVYQSRSCGHCNYQFAEMIRAQEELEALGYQSLAMSMVPPRDVSGRGPMLEHMLQSMGRRNEAGRYPVSPAELKAEYESLPFPVLADPDLSAGIALGVAYGRDDPMQLTYPFMGDATRLGFQGSPGGRYGPALYVFNTAGRVLYQWAWPDHKVRPSAETILAAARHCADPANLPAIGLEEALEDPDAVTHLSLADRGLTELPPEVLELKNLEELILYGNRLSTLPPGLSRLRNLRKLDLTRNRFTDLPPVVTELRHLEELQLFGNRLTTLPAAIGRLKKLVKLNLMFNPIERLPEEIGDLAELRYLRLCRHRMKRLPDTIGRLTELRMLFAPGTKRAPKNAVAAEIEGLEALPESIGNLENLVELNLVFNNLETLPASVGGLRSLQFLHLSENNLKRLPPELGDLPQMGNSIYGEGLHLRDNELTALPPTLGRASGYLFLNASYNRLTEIPPEVARNMLKASWGGMGLAHNRLTGLPAEAFWKRLRAGHNSIRAIPPAAFERMADYVDLSHNRIQSLPEAVAQARNVRVLDLSYNRISALPDLPQPPDIGRLDLSHNRLATVPDWINRMRGVALSGNRPD